MFATSTRILRTLLEYDINISVQDPWVNSKSLENEYGIKTSNKIPNKLYDGIIIAVPHNEYFDLDLNPLKKSKCVVYDVKGILDDKSTISL